MTRFYFNFSSMDDRIVDRKGVELEGLAAAHRQALAIVGRAVSCIDGQDWRGWAVEISDADGHCLLTVLFKPATQSRGTFGRRVSSARTDGRAPSAGKQMDGER